jgi:hypothetical protein
MHKIFTDEKLLTVIIIAGNVGIWSGLTTLSGLTESSKLCAVIIDVRNVPHLGVC